MTDLNSAYLDLPATMFYSVFQSRQKEKFFAQVSQRNFLKYLKIGILLIK
jgi:hypothetical protein